MDITKRHAAMLSEGLWSVILEKIIHRDLWDAEDVKFDNGGAYSFLRFNFEIANVYGH